MKPNTLMLLRNLVDVPQYSTLSHTVLDTGDLAEFCLTLHSGNAPIQFKAFVNVEVGENETSSDVEARYLQGGSLNFDKFIADFGPLHFVVRENFDNALERYNMDFLDSLLSNQEDFISLFSEEENLSIQDAMLNTYKSIDYLRQLGVENICVNSLLGVDCESMATPFNGSFNNNQVISPLIALYWLNQDADVKIHDLKLMGPEQVKLVFSARAAKFSNLQEIDYASINVTMLLKPDYEAQSFTVLELVDQMVQVNIYDEDFGKHYQNDLDTWIYDYSMVSEDDHIYQEGKMDQAVEAMFRSEAIAQSIKKKIFQVQ